jgi:quinol monooxygenase YgiN
MKVFKVSYTVQAAFVQKNQENIRAFFKDLQEINDPDLRYHVYRGSDGKTFYHFSEYNSDAAQKRLLELPSFRSFQQQRDQHLEAEPVIEQMEFVEATYAIF